MITVRECHDLELVRSVITHPSVWPWSIDDNTPPVEEFSVIDHEDLTYLAIYNHAEFVGIFMIQRVSNTTIDAHTCLLPAAYGFSDACGVAAIDYVFNATEYMKITTKVPANNILAMRLALRCGMRKTHTDELIWLRHGKLHDMHYLSINKSED